MYKEVASSLSRQSSWSFRFRRSPDILWLLYSKLVLIILAFLFFRNDWIQYVSIMWFNIASTEILKSKFQIYITLLILLFNLRIHEFNYYLIKPITMPPSFFKCWTALGSTSGSERKFESLLIPTAVLNSLKLWNYTN